VPVVLKSESFSLLEPSGPVHACNGIALPLLQRVWTFISIMHMILAERSELFRPQQHVYQAKKKKVLKRQAWKYVYDKKVNSDPNSEIQVIEFRRLQTLTFSQWYLILFDWLRACICVSLNQRAITVRNVSQLPSQKNVTYFIQSEPQTTQNRWAEQLGMSLNRISGY